MGDFPSYGLSGTCTTQLRNAPLSLNGLPAFLLSCPVIFEICIIIFRWSILKWITARHPHKHVYWKIYLLSHIKLKNKIHLSPIHTNMIYYLSNKFILIEFENFVTIFIFISIIKMIVLIQMSLNEFKYGWSKNKKKLKQITQ